MSSPIRPGTAEAAAVVAALKPRRRQAKKLPLSSNDRLVFEGPSLRSDVFPSPSTTPCHTSPTLPRRPLNSDLLHLLEHSPPHQEHSLTLRAPLRTGKDRFSQVWRAEVDLGGGERAPVVLKLHLEALFPEPSEENGRPWCHAEEYVRNEGDS
jgi:hypothetical protein